VEAQERQPSGWGRVRTAWVAPGFGAIARKLPPFRYPRFWVWFWRVNRIGRRSVRRIAESLGSSRFSKPAAHGMHERILAYVGDTSDGFFVEAGAYDGFLESNTYYLERIRGWRGVLIEPVPHQFRETVRARPGAIVFQCALVPFEHRGSAVTMRRGGSMTVVSGSRGSEEADRAWIAANPWNQLRGENGTITVPARTLTSILDEIEAPEVDFMSLDVEGFEPEVLRGLDLSRHPPRFLLVEIRDMDSERLAAVRGMLDDRYVIAEPLSPHDVLFVRRDQLRATSATETESNLTADALAARLANSFD
jgi:FkbM family methyltransferase